MDGRDLRWILVILLDDRTAREIAHGDDVVSMVHPVHLDAEDGWVHIASAAVEVGRMDVHYQGFACELLGVNACWIGQPVV